ncbi:MAG: hypothetical protein JO104_01650 [Candidatus Eremiobacteraeota bacterium]|nr:hypothetical protein [Candidatus Eremiobacteraeota bacterium]
MSKMQEALDRFRRDTPTTDVELERARRDSQSLAKRIQDTAGQDHAKIRAQASSVGEQARRLAQAIQSLLDDQATEGVNHLKGAYAALQALDKENQRLTNAEDSDVQAHNKASFAHAREAAHKVSEALAEKRGLRN